MTEMSTVIAAEAGDLIPLDDIAQHFAVSARTVGDRGWRRRAGLRVVKLGGRILGVRREDLAAALRREF